MVWNKGVTGYKFTKDKRIDNVDWRVVPSMLNDGLSSNDIAERLYVSPITVVKYIKIKYPEVINKLLQNNKIKRSHPKHGGLIGVCDINKFKREYCEKCGAKGVRLEIHHVIPAEYKEDWNIASGNHNPSNLQTLCNSCHQKIHYRELGRKSEVKHDSRTGRFVKNI